MDNWQLISVMYLSLSGICSSIIIIDLLSGNKQKMMIMNFVYPITALYGGPLALAFYYLAGKKSTVKRKNNEAKNKSNQEIEKPFWQKVSIGALHCGSGCTIGDIIAETLLLYYPLIIFGSSLVEKWAVDYLFAFIIGIIFQYYAIKPMKKLTPKQALIASLKADTLSLTFWQIGMYGWMAVAFFLLFKQSLEPNNPLFWFMMQIGMLLGFLTSYPINWWLIKKGIKEAM